MPATKLLTIAIPTYKRSARIDAQLAWLDRNIAGNEALCDVIISDNASPDDTPAICRKWEQIMAPRGVDFRINRNPQNVGPLPNIVGCIERSRTRFTWVIGDDDQIPDGKLKWVLEQLQADPALASIVLNFNSIGKTVYDRCFEFAADRRGDGWQIMQACLEQRYFGLAFMTAQIYRTEFVQDAIRQWPAGKANYDYQIFLTACTATHGRVLATAEPHVTYVTGDNVYEKDNRVGMKLYADSLDVFVHLQRIGYSGQLCRRLALNHLWGLKRRFVQRALQNNPLFTLFTSARVMYYLAALGARGLFRAKLTAPGCNRS